MKYKIAVSGAAVTTHCCKEIKEISERIGREIAYQKCILITGATTGVPYFVAQGCKKAGGFSIGFSPAISETAHLKTYKLPIDVFDIIIYTGADYVGRDIIMTKSADAVIIVCGRMGTLHEFAAAFETKKLIGILEGSGGTADKIRMITKSPHRKVGKIIYEKNPEELIKKIIKLIKEKKKKNLKILGKNHNNDY